jgi:hypothetical protein
VVPKSSHTPHTEFNLTVRTFILLSQEFVFSRRDFNPIHPDNLKTMGIISCTLKQAHFSVNHEAKWIQNVAFISGYLVSGCV